MYAAGRMQADRGCSCIALCSCIADSVPANYAAGHGHYTNFGLSATDRHAAAELRRVAVDVRVAANGYGTRSGGIYPAAVK